MLVPVPRLAAARWSRRASRCCGSKSLTLPATCGALRRTSCRLASPPSAPWTAGGWRRRPCRTLREVFHMWFAAHFLRSLSSSSNRRHRAEAAGGRGGGACTLQHAGLPGRTAIGQHLPILHDPQHIGCFCACRGSRGARKWAGSQRGACGRSSCKVEATKHLWQVQAAGMGRYTASTVKIAF